MFRPSSQDSALEELAQEFGTGYNKQTYIEFELDEEDLRSSGHQTLSTPLRMLIVTILAIRFAN